MGSDAKVVFDMAQDVSGIHTKDPISGNTSKQSMPYNVVLGHELTHAGRSMKGKAVNYKTEAAQGCQRKSSYTNKT